MKALVITRRIVMSDNKIMIKFKSEGEYADAMRNGRVFNNGGWVCKFDQDVLRSSGAYSPFVCMTRDLGEEYEDRWVPMDNTWKVNGEIFEIF